MTDEFCVSAVKEAHMAKNFWVSILVAAICTVSPDIALALNSNATDVHVNSADDPGYKAAMLSNDAMKAIQTADWQKARNLLEEAVKFDPNGASCMVHTNLGLVLEHFKEFDQAGIHLQKALSISPDDKSALEDMGSYYQQTGDFKQAVVYFQKYLKLYPDAVDAATIKGLADKLKSMKMATVDPSAKDYYADGTQGNFHRFSGVAPLKVYIAPGEGVPGFMPQYADFLKAALDVWANASQVLTWQKVDDPKAADITCKWVAEMAKTDGASLVEAGRAESSAMGHEIKNSRIVICTVAVAGADVTDDTMKYVCMHEVGHGLGLIGHSPFPDDVMFYSERQTKSDGLSDRDKATMAKLYATDLASTQRH
jgi:tetratricopeptide (TPR) repeat protein